MDDDLIEAAAELANQAALVLEWMDEDQRIWGAEAVARRRADMLHEALARYRRLVSPCESEAEKPQ